MHILIDARLYGLEHSGIGRYLINLLKELQKQDKENKYTIFLKKKYFKKLELTKNFKKVLVDIPHYTLKEQFLLPKKIKEIKPDLVHFPHFNISIFYRGDFVVTLHDMTIHKQKKDASKLPLPFYLLKINFYKLIFFIAVKRSKIIIVPSESVKQEIQKYYKLKKDKIKVIYEGITKLPKDGNEEKTLKKYNLTKNKYFFYAGACYPHKNIERVIKAVVLLNKERKEKIVFAIASSRNYFTKRLGKTIKKNKAEEYIKLLGFVKDFELGTLYKNSIAFVYPSLSEGFGLQGLEAMDSETLVLASNIPVFKEIYKENVIYFDPKSISSMESGLAQALRQGDSKKKANIEKGKQFIKIYDWAKMTKATIHAYLDQL